MNLKSLTKLGKEKVSPSWILFKKTFTFNLFTPLKFLLSVIFMILIPEIGILILNPIDIPLEYQFLSLIGYFVVIFTFNIIFSLIMIFSAAPLISDEIRSGTMLTLISKPISRIKIIGSKYLALLSYGLFISCCSLVFISLSALFKFPAVEVFQFFIIHLLYSILVLFIFGSLTISFSTIFKKPRNAALIPAVVVVFTFLIFMSFRSMLMWSFEPGEMPIYEKYQLYHFDLGYHLANVYYLIVESIISIIPTEMVFFFELFGLYKFDFNSLEYTQTNYYSPIGSLILLLVLTVIFLVIGIFYFKKRDISI